MLLEPKSLAEYDYNNNLMEINNDKKEQEGNNSKSWLASNSDDMGLCIRCCQGFA
jgi:hypothetical protein